MSDDFQQRISDAIDAATAQNDALSSGVAELLVGQTITAASAEVWSSDGEWAIRLELEDGSAIEVPGETWATGPLADLVEMAGGNPKRADAEDE